MRNPEEVERELKRMGYLDTAVVPWELAKAYVLWSKILWKLSKSPGNKTLIRRAMNVEKTLIVRYNKLIRQ